MPPIRLRTQALLVPMICRRAAKDWGPVGPLHFSLALGPARMHTALAREVRPHMRPDTWQRIQDGYDEFPRCRAEGVAQSEIDAASARLGLPFPADYQEFLRRYGAGYVDSHVIAGLRRFPSAPNDVWDVVGLTEDYRHQTYPQAERLVIFSEDGSGNPIGFDEQGRVWLSDHDCCESVCLERSFEDWLCRWVFRSESATADYVARERWSDEALERLRKRQKG